MYSIYCTHIQNRIFQSTVLCVEFFKYYVQEKWTNHNVFLYMFHCLHKGHTPLNLYFLINEKSQQQFLFYLFSFVSDWLSFVRKFNNVFCHLVRKLSINRLSVSIVSNFRLVLIREKKKSIKTKRRNLNNLLSTKG